MAPTLAWVAIAISRCGRARVQPVIEDRKGTPQLPSYQPHSTVGQCDPSLGPLDGEQRSDSTDR